MFFFAVMAICVATVYGQEPYVYPMPEHFPANSAAFPIPRELAWMKRVKNTNAAAAKRGSEIKLIFDGDSITQGWRGSGKNVWMERYDKYGAVNFGIGGDRTENTLWRLSQGQAKGLQPKLIALMIGTNNTLANSPEHIAEAIKAIVDKYREYCPNAVILLQAIFPRSEKVDDPRRATIKSINEIIAKFADGEKIIYVDFGNQFMRADGTLDKDIMPDFLHLSEKGYQIWADAIQPLIGRYLK